MKKFDKSHLLKGYLNEEKEKKWDNHFTNLKITEYDSYKDINYLSLRLIKAKLKYEKKEEKKLKRAYSKKESSLNNKKAILNSARANSNIDIDNIINKNAPNNLVVSKLTPRNRYIVKFNNTYEYFNKNKIPEYTKTIPNSCKKDKNIFNLDEKKIETNPKKKIFSPLYKTKNYSFKDNKNGKNKSYKNIYLNDILTKIKNDEELNELYINVKELWNNYGVTNLYQNNFLLSLNDYFLSKKILSEFLNIERKNMIKFKNEYTLVINKIEQRKNEITKIKKLIEKFSDKNNQNINIKNDIKNSLKLIRLYTINLVSQIKKFYLINSNLTLSGKIDLKKIKNENYNFDYKYLAEIKTELDFLKYSSINNLYNFNYTKNDPFLLSLSDISEYDNIIKNNNSKYDTLPITNEVYNQIIKLIFFMNQIEINEKIEKQNKIIINNNNNNFLNKMNNYSENYLSSNNELDTDNKNNIYLNNVKNVFNKYNNNYDEFYLNTISNYNKKKKKNLDKYKTVNIFIKTDKNNNKNNIKGKNSEEKIPLTTAEQLQNRFRLYDKIKQLMDNESNKKNEI